MAAGQRRRNFGAACGVDTGVAMSSPRRVATAVVLAGLALAIASIFWLSTRKLVPLDIPISLSRGHVRTEEFGINLNSGYYIEIEVEKALSLDNLECQMWGCYEEKPASLEVQRVPAILRAQWVLSSAGNIKLSGHSEEIDGASGNLGVVGSKVGYFLSSGGRYRLDVDVLSDTSVLNKGNPRLKVEADGEGYNRLSRLNETLAIIPGMVVVVGLALLLLSCSQQSAEQSTVLGLSAAPGIGHQGESFFQKFPPRRLSSRLSPFVAVHAFGLLYGVILLLIAVPMMLICTIGLGVWPWTSSRGLDVWITKPMTLMTDFQGERVIVTVQRTQGGTLAANESELRLNSRPVSWRDLSELLRTELSRHADRVVYVEGEGDLEVGDIVRVVDVAREAWYGVPVVLLTPKLKKGLEAERAGARQDRPSKSPLATQNEPKSKSR